MSDNAAPTPASPPEAPAAASGAPVQPPKAAPTGVPPQAAPQPAGRGLLWIVAAGLLALSVGGVVLAFQAQQRVQSLEQELVRRQQDSQEHATEARALARQAQDVSRDTAAKVALVEARLAEMVAQRSQLEELMQALSRSRDENVLVDIDAALRMALQQTSITGSAEPLVAALRAADERLQRLNQPRLEGVRRAIARDLERVKAVSLADVASLVIKLDEAARLTDDLPLWSGHASLRAAPPDTGAPGGTAPAARAASASSPAASPVATEWAWWQNAGALVWAEMKSLVRVTRVDRPESLLMAPDQAFFLRENLKLRLLNARLALLGRQFDTVQADVQSAQAALERYFDRSHRRVQHVGELLRQVAAQANHSAVPRPDDTLATLAAVTGR